LEKCPDNAIYTCIVTFAVILNALTFKLQHVC